MTVARSSTIQTAPPPRITGAYSRSVPRQRSTPKLARRGSGEPLGQDDLARRRVAGEGGCDERPELVERRGVGGIGRDDPHGDALAPLRIRAAARGHVSDPGVLAERRLDLVRPDLLPPGADQVVEPTHDAEATLGVDLARVAGPQPSVLGERGRGGRGVEPVAPHLSRPPELDAA